MPEFPVVQPQPLRVLLARIADELHDLQENGRVLEDAIGRTILGEEPTTSATLANLQEIDMIVQTLGELGTFVHSVTGVMDDHHTVDANMALSRIKLRDLARKLSGGARQPIVNDHGEISGEVDLF